MREDLLKQLAQWHEDNEFQNIVDAILALPEGERDYELKGQLARALNNLEDYETAVEMLLSVEKEGGNDPLWFYRLGYAYYYSDMPAEAEPLFEKVLEFNPEDSDAQMFLGWCKEELKGRNWPDELNNRLIPGEMMTTGKTFRERVDDFWDWFAANECKLSEMIEQREQANTDEMVAFVAEGVKLVSEDINFNIGGDYEFSFAVEGNNYLFYLLPWLVARMPVQFLGKWHFSPYLQGTHGKNFTFQMYGVSIASEEVSVKMTYDQKRNYFDLWFYQEKLAALETASSYNAFYMMMELSIGEGLSRIYINDVIQAEKPETGMFPLTELERRMKTVVVEGEQEMLTRPDERYTVFKMRQDENKDLRYDMIVGTTCFPELMQDYFDGETKYTEALRKCGARAVFLAFPCKGEEDSDALKLRYEIEDRLTNEVLGERGSGQEIGILLGGVMGYRFAYIDLLLYDAPAFLAKAGKVLEQYTHPFYLSDFRQESRLVALAGVEAEVPAIPEVPGELALQLMEFLDCPGQWFAPATETDQLEVAYAEALQKGKEEGFIPVWVKVDRALLEGMKVKMGLEENTGIDIGKVRAWRKQIQEEIVLPDAALYFEELTARQEAELEEDEEELLDEVRDGRPNTLFSACWNYNTRLTDEMLLMQIPVDTPWKIFTWLPVGNWGTYPDAPYLMAVAGYWYEKYRVLPATVTYDELEFYSGKPVQDARMAMQLALQQYGWCPALEQSDETLGQKADGLRQSKVWYFWWE